MIMGALDHWASARYSATVLKMLTASKLCSHSAQLYTFGSICIAVHSEQQCPRGLIPVVRNAPPKVLPLSIPDMRIDLGNKRCRTITDNCLKSRLHVSA